MATPDDNSHAVMQPFQCNLQPQIQETNRTTHIDTTTRCRTQRRNPCTSGTTPAATAAHTRYLSSTLHGKMQGFVLRLPPQNKAHATFMQPLHHISQHHVANLHLATHMATPDDNNHVATPMRSATTDSRNAKNYAHRHNHSLQNTEEKPNTSGTTPAAPAAHTHKVPFIAACSHFTRKNARFRAPASSPKQSPCNIHAAITIRFAASRSKPASLYAHGNTR